MDIAGSQVLISEANARLKLEKSYNDRSLGNKVSRAFNRCSISFTPYDLRHAFAIRGGVACEIPATTMAALMGHTPKVHMERYQRHINLKQNRAATDKALSRPDRPLPPVVKPPAV